MILARNPKSESEKSLFVLYDLKQERLVLPIIYDRIVCDSHHPWFDVAEYVLAYREGKAVLIDRNGKETMPLEYEQIDYKELPDGEYLIPAYKDGLWGYINAYGTLKIPCRYLMAGQFNEGKAVVYYASLRGNVRMVDYTKGRMDAMLIDHHGNVIGKCEDEGAGRNPCVYYLAKRYRTLGSILPKETTYCICIPLHGILGNDGVGVL